MKFLQRFSRKPSASDEELDARLSRLRSEFAQARAAAADADSNAALDEIEHGLEDAEALARGTDHQHDSRDPKAECIRLAHEVEAELCMLKPVELLYPTWTRLRQKLYRLDDEGKGRKEAWNQDMEVRISADSGALDSGEERMLRQRLRQLTLELRESALRFNRRNDERAEVIRALAKVSVWMALAFGAAIVACLTLSACDVGCRASTLVLLIASASAGGLGALLSRTAVPREERVRPEFKELLKWDLLLRVCIGAAAAVLVAAILLSERLFLLPPGSMSKAAYVVVFGFGAGFSDRFFKSMLGRAIGTRRGGSSGDKE